MTLDVWGHILTRKFCLPYCECFLVSKRSKQAGPLLQPACPELASPDPQWPWGDVIGRTHSFPPEVCVVEDLTL